MNRTARFSDRLRCTSSGGWGFCFLVSFFALPAIGLAQGPGYEWGWEAHPMWWMWGAWGIGMMVVMLLFWVLVIVGLIVGIRWLLGQGKAPGSDTAIEILRQRYARGEVSREDFERMKGDLR